MHARVHTQLRAHTQHVRACTQGELETKSKFWGKSVEVFLYGCEVLRVKHWGDEFRWSRATICVSDVILGNYWVQVGGSMEGWEWVGVCARRCVCLMSF
jgi:hypothetical protein